LADNITIYSLPRGWRIHSSRDEQRVVSTQELQVDEEEGFVSQPARPTFAEARIKKWTTKTAAEDVLHELFFRLLSDRNRITLGVESRRAVILKRVAVKIVRAGARNECDLSTTAAAELGGEVARHHLELLHRIRIRTKRRKV